MAKIPKINLKRIDFSALADKIAGQFRGLNPNDPASWPLIPRSALCVGVTVVIVVGLWLVWLQSVQDELSGVQMEEVKLKDQYKSKLGQAINLDALRKQREQVLQYVTQLEKQLPSTADMDALLQDISQAANGRNLQSDLFKPGQVTVKEYYAELPIAIKVVGRYNDIGAFAGDIAQLSRIVTLNNLVITPSRDGFLWLDTQAKTFRYLSPDEVSAQKSSGANKGAKK